MTILIYSEVQIMPGSTIKYLHKWFAFKRIVSFFPATQPTSGRGTEWRGNEYSGVHHISGDLLWKYKSTLHWALVINGAGHRET